MKTAVIAGLLALAICAPSFAAQHPCAAEARKQAEKLLALHMDGADMNVSIGDKVSVKAPVKALKGKGRFDVLEVTGYVYKAQYRIRMIYAQIPDSCVLMGQEILEIANPY